MSPSTSTRINSVMFNAQQDCFALATEGGVRMFNSHPAVLLRSLGRAEVGGVKFCNILHRSNIIVFVGAGSSAKYPANTVMVWDDKQGELILEITVTGGPITNVLIAYSKLVVLQDRRMHVFQFPNPCQLIRTEDIRYNPLGLAAIGCDYSGSSQMLAYPGFKIGSVQLVNLNNLSESSSLSPCTIDAHLTEISQLALNNQGTLVATGSMKGTVIRVFDIGSLRCVMECRRGADPSNLHCIQFSPCSSYLAVSSDKGTIHIFAIKESDESANKRGILHKVGLVKGERRSYAQIALEPRVLSCGFIKGTSSCMQSIVAVCDDGSYHRFSLGVDGTTKREGFDHLMQLADEQEFWTRPF